MSDTEPSPPRRAFEASDGGSKDDAGEGVTAASPSRAWAPSDDADTSESAGRLNPGEGSDEPRSPEVATPIPPPAPTLPDSPQAATSGRRFSAEPPTEDSVPAAPRRSAASVSSPPVDGDLDAAVGWGAVSATATPDVAAAEISSSEGVRPDSGAVGSEPPGGARTAGAEAAARRKRRPLLLIAGAVTLVLIVGALAWFGSQRSGSANPPATPSASPTAGTPTPPPTLDETQLITAAELARMRRATTWTVQDPNASTGVPRQPACIELSRTGHAAPESEVDRVFAADNSGGVLRQFAQAWPDATGAGTAYEALVAQVGACDGAHILSGYRISGLADAVTGLTATLPDGTAHTFLIIRSGRFVDVINGQFDGTKPLGMNALTRAVAPSMARQCTPAQGVCPATPRAAAAPPPPTETIGWLAWVDLPRITAGAGTWTATDPEAPKLVGSQCEDVNLNKLPDSTSSAHRTYLLTDDAKAPEGFGIDEAQYTFAKASDATAVARALNGDFGDCAERTRTASVKASSVTAPDAEGKKLRATSYLVTQRISDSRTVTFRVGVAAVGSRLFYLLANPSSGFDFTDDTWEAIVGRAAQRTTQAS